MKKQKVLLLTILAAIAGGVTPAFAKIALETMTSGTLTVIRFVITLAALILATYLSKKKVNWDSIFRAFPVNLFFAINPIGFAIGIKYIQASSIQIIYTLSPIVVALLSWAILRQKTDLGKIIGILIGFVGVGLVIIAPAIAKSQAVNFSLLGTLVILLAASGYSVFTVLSKRLQKFASLSEITISGCIATIASQLIFSLSTGSSITMNSVSGRSLLASLVVAAVGTTSFYLLIQYIVKIGSPLQASLNLYIMPVFGAFFAFIILGDKLSPLAMIGGIIALIGVAQVNGLWATLLTHKRQKPITTSIT